MSAATTTSPVTLGGDPRARAAGRWRRVRGPLLVVGVLVLVGLLAALLRPLTSADPLAPDNPRVALDPGRDNLGMPDVIVGHVDHAGNENLVVRQADALEDVPVVLMGRRGSFDQDRPWSPLEDDWQYFL